MSATSSPRKKGGGHALTARPPHTNSPSHNYIAIISLFSITVTYTHAPEPDGRRGGAR